MSEQQTMLGMTPQDTINLALTLANIAAQLIAGLRTGGMTDEQITQLAGETENNDILALLADLANDRTAAQAEGRA